VTGHGLIVRITEIAKTTKALVILFVILVASDPRDDPSAVTRKGR